MWRSLPPISIIFLSSSLRVIPAIASPFLENRFAQNFFQRGLARGNFDQSAAAESDHALLDGFLLEFQRGGADENEFAELIVDFHDFVQTGTAFVATFVANVAAFAVIDLGGLELVRRVARVDERL